MGVRPLHRDIGSLPGSNLTCSFSEASSAQILETTISAGVLAISRGLRGWGGGGGAERGGAEGANSDPNPNPTSHEEPEAWIPGASPGSSGRAGPHTHLFLEILGWNRLWSIHQPPGTGIENISGLLLHFSLQPSQIPLLEDGGGELGVECRLHRIHVGQS